VPVRNRLPAPPASLAEFLLVGPRYRVLEELQPGRGLVL